MARTRFVLTGVGLCLIAAAYLFMMHTPPVKADTSPGIIATIATSSNPTVGTTALTLFSTSTCADRIITTYANPIMLTFSDYAAQTPTGTFGHLQAASTTVVYSAGQYGCGLYKAISANGASAAITVSESR